MNQEQRLKAQGILYVLEKEASRSSLTEFFEVWGIDIEDWKDFKKTVVDHFQLDGTELYIKIED